MQAITILFWGKARHDGDAVSGTHSLAAKCRGNDEFVVVGHGTGAKGRMTLLLGARRGDTLVYLGRVGSGIGERQERDLARRLAPLCREYTGPGQGAGRGTADHDLGRAAAGR